MILLLFTPYGVVVPPAPTGGGRRSRRQPLRQIVLVDEAAELLEMGEI